MQKVYGRADILKLDFFCAVKTLVLVLTKNHKTCVKPEKESVKEAKMHKFLVCIYKSQDFAQRQKNFARSHDPETMTFTKSVAELFVR